MAQKCDEILWVTFGTFDAELSDSSKKMAESFPQLRLLEEIDGEGIDGEGGDVCEDGEVMRKVQ